MRVHSLVISRSQDLALLSICCSISVSGSSKPAAFPGFNRLRPVASSSKLRGLVSSVGGWLFLCGGLRCSSLLPLDKSWLVIWSAVTVLTTGGVTLSAPIRRMDAHAFLLFMVRLVVFAMSLQILRLSSDSSSSKVSPSWIVDSENGSLWYSSSWSFSRSEHSPDRPEMYSFWHPLLHQDHKVIVVILVCRDICNGMVNVIAKVGPISFLYVEASSKRAMRDSDWRYDGYCDMTVLCTWDGEEYSSPVH